jgi:hypothetical protein
VNRWKAAATSTLWRHRNYAEQLAQRCILMRLSRFWHEQTAKKNGSRQFNCVNPQEVLAMHDETAATNEAEE